MSEAQLDGAGRIGRRRRLRRRMLATIAGSYALTTAMLLLYAGVGTTPLRVPVLYAVSGGLVCAVFFAAFSTRLGERTNDWFLTIWQLLPSAAVEIAFLAIAPEVGFVFLMVLFVIFGFGTLRLTPAKALTAWGVTALGVAVVLLLFSGPLVIPGRTPAERWITALCFIVTLGRCVGTGLLGSQYRIQLAERTTALQRLTATLEDQVAEIKTLQGILPICAYCKKIRDDKGAWTQLEGYISARTDVLFSHGICTECRRTHFPSVPLRTE